MRAMPRRSVQQEESLPSSASARRSRAVAAAREIAAEGGYDALTMHEVARRSGVSRATLYRYFTSKDQLLVEVSLQFNDELRADLEQHPPQGGSVAERLTEVFSRVLEAVAQQPRLTAATLRALFADDPVVRDLAPEVRRFGGAFVDAGLRGVAVPHGDELARVLGPLSLAMVIRIGSGHCTLAEAIDEIRCAVSLMVRE
jgi:AcrR family transcriptional regulator